MIAEPPLDDLHSKARQHVGGGPASDDLEAPRRDRSPGDDREQDEERHGDRIERVTVEGTGRDVGDQDGLGEDQKCREDAESDVGGEHRPDGAPTADEARVEA